MKLNFKFGFLKLKKTRSLDEWRRINQHMNPLRDWTISIVVAVLLFIGGVSYTAYDFIVQLQATAPATSEKSKPVLYHEKEVVQYAETYTEREQTFNELRNVVVKVPELEKTGRATTTAPASPVTPPSQGKPVAE
jgi:hypothetical protein